MRNQLMLALLPLHFVLACGADEDVAAAVVVDPAPDVAIVDPPKPRDAVAAGRALFLHAWTRGDERSRGGDGLGPLFNASSCVACHSEGGTGGGGGNHHNVVIGDGRVFHRHGGGPVPTAGSGFLGLIGIGGLGSAGGEGFHNPEKFGDIGRGNRAPAPSVVVERNTPALFGAGLIDTIPEEVIEASASTSIAGHPEITGKVGRDAEGRVTRFGWKADVADLLTFVSRACSVELGLEVPGSPQPGPRKKTVPGLDIDLVDLEDLVAYVRDLPRPIEQRTHIANEGAELFDSIGCTGCHSAALGDVDGLYSDLLLHDMGVELDDNGSVGYYGAQPTSAGNEWRTPPLWGVRDSAPYLHDGRARSLGGAVALHGGEAWRARQQYWALDDDGRAAVIAFLESLQAPAEP